MVPILQTSQVFSILALCAHEPLPMSIFKRFLRVESTDDPRIQAIKDCDLLTVTPERGRFTDNYDSVETVETVCLYKEPREVFNFIFNWRGE